MLFVFNGIILFNKNKCFAHSCFVCDFDHPYCLFLTLKSYFQILLCCRCPCTANLAIKSALTIPQSENYVVLEFSPNKSFHYLASLKFSSGLGQRWQVSLPQCSKIKPLLAQISTETLLPRESSCGQFLLSVFLLPTDSLNWHQSGPLSFTYNSISHLSPVAMKSSSFSSKSVLKSGWNSSKATS